MDSTTGELSARLHALQEECSLQQGSLASTQAGYVSVVNELKFKLKNYMEECAVLELSCQNERNSFKDKLLGANS